MMKIDFHIHTEYSKDSMAPIEAVYKKAKLEGLGKLIITDHNTITGAQKLKEFDPNYVIVGEEIMTTEGEILAAFVEKEIPAGWTPYRVIDELKKQGAFISLSHPFVPGHYGWSKKMMKELLPYLDAIEISNGRNLRLLNNYAGSFAKENGICGTAGSDAHDVSEIGRMGLEIPYFNNAERLKIAIPNAKVYGDLSSVFVRYYSRKAVLQKRLRKAVHSYSGYSAS